MRDAKNVLITGVAGFIGFHLAQKLFHEGYRILGLDNLNDYYDIGLKHSRLSLLKQSEQFTFYQVDLVQYDSLKKIFLSNDIDYVVHLAAQAGVRYSISNPHAYLHSNFHGFLNVLECCRHFKVRHLVYASSSSVYGANKKMPFSEHDHVDHPISFYAASKKANELMAHSYSALYNLPTTGLRFFTVYGPYGRPDMALFMFTRAIIEGQAIEIFNNGRMKRDFTYVDDIVEGISRLITRIAKPNVKWSGLTPDPATSFAPFQLFNIGSNNPVDLSRFIEIIEKKLNMKAIRKLMPLQDGDVTETFADVEDLHAAINYRPSTSIETGIGKFVDWYLDYYKIPIKLN